MQDYCVPRKCVDIMVDFEPGKKVWDRLELKPILQSSRMKKK